MKIVFMGTPSFANASLEALLNDGYEVAAVVCQPDRPKGRKQEPASPPVKQLALQYGIPVWQPFKLRGSETEEHIKAIRPDLIVTAAYGQLLPNTILTLPPIGCINVHASLLPRYRGGAPIHHAIMNGESITGVTIMFMAESLDTGDIISQTKVPITDDDNTGTMFEKLSRAGARLLIDTIPDLAAGKYRALAQDHTKATYAPNLSRDDERIVWEQPARQIFNRIRGLNPSPGAYTTYEGHIMKIWAAKPPTSTNVSAEQFAPGTVLHVTENGIEVQTGSGTIVVTKLQLAGKKSMEVKDYVRGRPMSEGTVLGRT